MATVDQKQYLIDFVCENYIQLFGQLDGPFGKDAQKEKWNDLIGVLNGLGPKKEAAYWRKVRRSSFMLGNVSVSIQKVLILFGFDFQLWSTIKSGTKAKVNEHRAQCYRTGGGSPPRLDLTANEKKIINAVGYYAVDGDDEIFEIGVVNPPGYRGLESLEQQPTTSNERNSSRKRSFSIVNQPINEWNKKNDTESDSMVDLTADSDFSESEDSEKPNPSKRKLYSVYEKGQKAFDLQKRVIESWNTVSEKVNNMIDLEKQQVSQNAKIIECLKKIYEEK